MKQLKRAAKSSVKGPKLSCNAQLGPLLISETVPTIQANPFYLVTSYGENQRDLKWKHNIKEQTLIQKQPSKLEGCFCFYPQKGS